MNREIKFRAWKKIAKTMEVGNFALGANGCIIFSDNDFLGPTQIELMQFIGLKDKNGKDIYEGDIVEYTVSQIPLKQEIHEVIWYQSGFGFKKLNEDSSTALYLPISKLEVIGNIYENPEILKEVV